MLAATFASRLLSILRRISRASPTWFVPGYSAHSLRTANSGKHALWHIRHAPHGRQRVTVVGRWCWRLKRHPQRCRVYGRAYTFNALADMVPVRVLPARYCLPSAPSPDRSYGRTPPNPSAAGRCWPLSRITVPAHFCHTHSAALIVLVTSCCATLPFVGRFSAALARATISVPASGCIPVHLLASALTLLLVYLPVRR